MDQNFNKHPFWSKGGNLTVYFNVPPKAQELNMAAANKELDKELDDEYVDLDKIVATVATDYELVLYKWTETGGTSIFCKTKCEQQQAFDILVYWLNFFEETVTVAYLPPPSKHNRSLSGSLSALPTAAKQTRSSSSDSNISVGEPKSLSPSRLKLALSGLLKSSRNTSPRSPKSVDSSPRSTTPSPRIEKKIHMTQNLPTIIPKKAPNRRDNLRTQVLEELLRKTRNE